MADGPADASCAGPQLRLQQDGAPIEPRRAGLGDAEQLLYDVDRNQPLHVDASHLTFDCDDTPAARPGCGAPPAGPTVQERPVVDAALQVEQRDRAWVLGRLDVAPDLTDSLDVRLPDDLRAGTAVLMIIDPANGAYAELTLVVAGPR